METGEKRDVIFNGSLYVYLGFETLTNRTIRKRGKKGRKWKITFKMILEDVAVRWGTAFSNDSATLEWLQHCQYKSYGAQ